MAWMLLLVGLVSQAYCYTTRTYWRKVTSFKHNVIINNLSRFPTPVRLVDGFNKYSGRVEVYYRGQWGTICDDAFDRDDVHVICRMLGMYHGSSYGVVYDVAFFGQGTGPITIDDLQCNGYEKDIAECRSQKWLVHNCGHGEDVGVDCRGTTKQSVNPFTSVPQANFHYTKNLTGLFYRLPRHSKIRLVDGPNSRSGRVEIYYKGSWGTVCDDNFDLRDARVICRTLFNGISSRYGVAHGNAYYGQGSGDIIIDGMRCNGNENSIEDCSTEAWGTHDCTHEEDAGVDCNSYDYYGYTGSATQATTNSVRLVGGSYNHGRVEIYRNGEWMTVCENTLSHEDVQVICRELGYNYGYEYGRIYGSSAYGRGSSYHIIHSLHCRGYEENVLKCDIQSSSRNSYCNHYQDAGIHCGVFEQTTASSIHVGAVGTFSYYTNGYYRNLQIRLVNGHSSRSGRVEVYYNGRWGTICDDSFDSRDARVICRNLFGSVRSGYGAAYGNAHFGQGSGAIHIDEMQCSGSENDIGHCRSNQWGQHDCSHSEDAGIDCDSRADVPGAIHGYYDVTTIDTPFSTVTNGRVRLVNGYSYSGRVEIYRSGEWMTVCENTLSHDDVRVICRELGYSYGYQYGRIYGSGHYGRGSSYHIIHSLTCRGYESRVSQCSMQSYTRNGYCYHSQDGGIDCSAYQQETTVPMLEVSTVQPYSVRLVNGYGYSGRLEIFQNGQWMSVCARYLTHNDLKVICRQLGYYQGPEYGRIFPGAATFGEGSSYYIVDDISCKGYESSLSQCRLGYRPQKIYCSHTSDAGLNCYDYNWEMTTEAYSSEGQVRLVGGSSYSGRVEIYRGGQWMTVCSNTLDHNDIKTICRSLGHYYGSNRGVERAPYFYGQGSTYNIIHYLGCYGYESGVSQCGITSSYRGHYCSHSQDGGIDCSGYYYETTTPYYNWYAQTTAGSVLEDAITVSCNENGWDITINMYRLRQQYPNARADEIYLGENSCVGNDNGYNVHFTQGLRQCLTSQMIRNDDLVYRNQLIYAERDRLHPFLIRHYNWTVDVECDVMRNETSKGHLHHNSGGSSNNHQVSGTSHYCVNMSFYSDPNFRYQLYGYPLSVNVGDKVYVKVFSPNSDWTIKMKVHTCYTKPNDVRADYQKYYIIKNGCEMDGNTHIISQSSHETRFVFQDFEYTSNHEGIYIYCDATFCPSSDYSSSCSQTCNPIVRRRRLPHITQNSTTYEPTTIDPFITSEPATNDEWTEMS